MARSSATDKRHLELHHGKWRVTLAVPRALHTRLGTRLKRPLQTDSLAVANRVKWQVLAEMRAELDAAQDKVPRPVGLRREALEIASLIARAQTDAELEHHADTIRDRAEEIRGKPVEVIADPYTGEELPVFDPEREAQAGSFAALASGDAIPIDLHHATFIAQSHVKSRTTADDRRAIRFLLSWCEAKRVAPTLQAITRRSAIRFLDDLPGVAGGQGPVTLKKYLNRLSVYWAWLEVRGHVEMNVWTGLTIKAPKTKHDEQERAFTDAEVRKLLDSGAPAKLMDVIHLGALTGARLDAIVDLKVKDCADGLFVFKPQKKEPAPRAVPIHPDLVELVARRVAGRSPDDDLFPEWPAPRKAGSMRERSFKTSNAFTDYRREAGVDEVVAGKRRSLVNFHSFRRWFITKAEQAGQPESIIAAVVGHKRKGMTLGRYSAGPLVAQARACVEAVKLPPKPGAAQVT